MAKNKSSEGVSAHRIEALTDGIFAFAMTLLVLSINIPLSTKALAGMSVSDTLLEQTDRFVNYAMSFLLLAIFWVSHHRVFDHLKCVDWKLVWGNILVLLFVALIPFATELVNEFPKDSTSDFLFSLNLFIIGSLYYLLWDYATSGFRLVKSTLGDDHIKNTKRGILVIPIVSLFAMVIAVIYPAFSSFIYILIPIFLFMPSLTKKH
jgi:uncharacterized membrane protein